ncbi:putative selenium metabolism protein, YedE family [Lachnospiraceae bacterium JC7]|nr:putative selenium metabolism protein, YedE family [Lachnospiraceae bacterium JC7]
MNLPDSKLKLAPTGAIISNAELDRTMSLLDSKLKLALTGAVFGVFAVILALSGNPGNMAICVACFIRDIAGAMKLHTAAPVQYFRPEIVGFIMGSFLISMATKEFRATGGSAPMIRFILGFAMMVGALVFLGCPLRMLLRMSAGDLNAYVALIGFAAGVGTGTFFLKRGYSLGRSTAIAKTDGYVLPAGLLVLFVLSLTTALFAVSEKGPGSMHAPALAALFTALLFGALAQKNRVCFAGSIRDVILLKDFSLISILGGFFVVMLIFNIAHGSFKLSFTGQPVAHARHIWNILGMYLVGFAAVLAGGCPMRQLILAGQGSSDSAVTVLGMLVGAACAHNFGLAGATAAAATETAPATAGGPSAAGQIAVIALIAVTFVIAVTNQKKIEI